MKDGPSGSAIRSLIPSHRKPLRSKAVVVSVAETPGLLGTSTSGRIVLTASAAPQKPDDPPCCSDATWRRRRLSIRDPPKLPRKTHFLRPAGGVEMIRFDDGPEA